MTLAARYPDLGPRVASAAVMLAVGALALWLGGVWFQLLAAAAVGTMSWETGRMPAGAEPARAIALGLVAGLVVFFVSRHLGGAVALAALAAAWAALATALAGRRAPFAAYLALILFAGHGLIVMRAEFGAAWLLWLIAVVVASDVAGYFAGRALGGPRLWPRVSPKKTWSGTIAGWVLAVGVGAAFMAPLEAGAGILALSVVICMAGQAGDIAESALKRHAGVKDSSALIPGHGGVMDRFDAMLGAALAFLILARTGALGAIVGGG